jgi:cytochrome c oxidase subunit II
VTAAPKICDSDPATVMESATIAQTPPFAHPGVHRLADGSYEAYIVADASQFYPSVITIPSKSRVAFFVTSTHTIRGFAIAETEVSMMAGPGWVKTATHTFDIPNTYALVCSQHCGFAHMTMHAIVKVQ